MHHTKMIVLLKYLHNNDFNPDTFSDESIQDYDKTMQVKVVPHNLVYANPHTSRIAAGNLAAQTRRAARTTVKVDGKTYSVFSRSLTGAVRVPRMWVNPKGFYPGDKVLIVGSKGLKQVSINVKTDGSLVIPSNSLKSFKTSSFLIRWDSPSKRLVVRAN